MLADRKFRKENPIRVPEAHEYFEEVKRTGVSDVDQLAW